MNDWMRELAFHYEKTRKQHHKLMFTYLFSTLVIIVAGTFLNLIGVLTHFY